MNFAQELKIISDGYKSPKLENIKIVLKDAAKDGKKNISIDSEMLDNTCLLWLKNEGVTVSGEFGHQKDGFYYNLSW